MPSTQGEKVRIVCHECNGRGYYGYTECDRCAAQGWISVPVSDATLTSDQASTTGGSE